MVAGGRPFRLACPTTSRRGSFKSAGDGAVFLTNDTIAGLLSGSRADGGIPWQHVARHLRILAARPGRDVDRHVTARTFAGCGDGRRVRAAAGRGACGWVLTLVFRNRFHCVGWRRARSFTKMRRMPGGARPGGHYGWQGNFETHVCSPPPLPGAAAVRKDALRQPGLRRLAGVRLGCPNASGQAGPGYPG